MVSIEMAQVPPTLAVLVVVVGWWASGAVADFASDQAECGEKLVVLATCLPYAEGSAKSPTPDCCSGLKVVVANSPKCLCILIKDRDNPQLGFKIDVNRALSLPSICSAPANISDCPKFLNLSPNSPEAQVFKVIGRPPQGSGTGISSVKGNSTSSGKSDGIEKNGASSGHYWKGKRWVAVFSLVVFFMIMSSF